MKYLRRIIYFVLITAVLLSLLPVGALAIEEDWGEPGNLDLNILNGGLMLNKGEDFYYSDRGIYLERGGVSTMLTQEDGRNLNLAGDWLYYTLSDGTVRRIAANGGEPETVYSHGSEITRLYTIGEDSLRFISDGMAYGHDLNTGETVLRSSLTGIRNLLPTEYGDIYTTGAVFDYNVYAGETLVLEHVTGCYTDSGYLALTRDCTDYQVSLERLFNGFNEAADLEPFNIHGTVELASLMEPEGEAHLCPECEANALKYDFGVSLMNLQDENIDPEDAETEEPVLIPEVSQGQKNIVLRARQLHEIRWTPLEDRYQWGYRGVFEAETTYTGLPYGQAVYTGYVGWNVSFAQFAAAVNDNTSKFYTDYSWYNKIAPYYATDCSGFVSYAWNMKYRHTTYNIPNEAERVSDQSIYSMQVGDCLNHATSHVVLVSDVWYNEAGEVISVEIMEQTPVITRLRRYGEEGSYALSRLQSYYLNGGYVLYRNPLRDEVEYTHSCEVPLDGDYCENCKTTVPKTTTTGAVGSKTVALSHEDSTAVIYYTLDGSAPTANSIRYTEPITVYETTKLRAIAVTEQFAGSSILEYTVKVPPVATPTASVTSGIAYNDLVTSGSQVSLSTSSAGATLYYTLDGTEPTTESEKYTGPITITKDTTIKVMGQANGMSQSETAVFSYKLGTAYTITATAGTGGSISPSGAVGAMETSTTTFTITANSGWKITDVKVDGVSVGALSSYTFENLSKNHSISAVFQEVVEIPFTDVPANAWYLSAVNYVYKNGLFSGTTATTFSPNSPMTRGMLVTVLARLSGQDRNLTSGTGIVTGDDVRIREEPNTECDVLGVSSKYTAVQILGQSGDWYKIRRGSITGYIRGDYISIYRNTFTDLPSGQYYSPYVEWAYLSGIVSGTSSTTFSPTSNITREQLCALLYNYTQKYGLTLPKVNSRVTFSDDSSIASYAKTAVYAMQQAGLISGKGGNTFDPKGTATRAEVAQILKNFSSVIS